MKSSSILFCLVSASAISTSPSFAQDVTAPDNIPAPNNLTAENLAEAPSIKGKLSFKVIIVDDLVPKPVPFSDFIIRSVSEDGGVNGEPLTARTSETGTFDIELKPGKYKIEGAKPLKFKGKTYEWKSEVIVTADQTATVALTGDDAIVHEDVIPTTRQVADEAKIYRAKVDGVATIEGESGHGTGFLIDPRGLILTNQHVVEGSRRLVARFHHGLRVEAKLIASDPNLDVAILRVNPSVVKDLPVVALFHPEEGESLVTEGEKVLTIGSPLMEEKILTTGIVSKVKDGVIISDININPGNSGGPLLNLAGEAVGLTTFGEAPSQGGPGISGIVSIDRAYGLVSKALADLEQEAGAVLPSDNLMPDFSKIKIPGTLLTEAAQKELKVPQLDAPSSFQTRFYTPFILASIEFKEERELAKKKQKRKKNESPNGDGAGGQKPIKRFYSGMDSYITIGVAPKMMESKGSKKRGLFGAVLGGMTGTFVNTKRSMEFRHAFYDMELWRDGVLVEPIRRNRVPISYYYENQLFNFEAKDATTAGLYFYDPAAFRPGGALVLKVKREYNTDRIDTVKISDALRASLYDQFGGYWSLSQSDTPAASDSETSKLR